MIIINPGTESNTTATVENAEDILTTLMLDPRYSKVTATREAHRDDGGRFSWTLSFDGKKVDVDIPGDDPEVVMSSTPFKSRRLYVDGSSWLWQYAAGIIDDSLFGDESLPT